MIRPKAAAFKVLELIPFTKTHLYIERLIMTAIVKLDIKELPNVTTAAALKVELAAVLPVNWGSAFCNKKLNNQLINDIAADIERKGGYTTTQEFVKELAAELWAVPDKRTQSEGASRPRQPRNSKVAVTKLPKKEVEKTKLFPSREAARLSAVIRQQQEELKEAIDTHDFKTADTIQSQIDTTQAELDSQLAPFITQEQLVAQATQEVEELKEQANQNNRHYKEVLEQIAALKKEALRLAEEGRILTHNLNNRKKELRELEAGRNALSDDYSTLDLETYAIHSTQLVHIPAKMAETLDNLKTRLANAEAVNGEVFVEKDKLQNLRKLKETYVSLGMAMPADLDKELGKIERGYEAWLAAK